ncbi:hypothetical protein UlMin_000636 [Ulmus minor]
MDRYQRVEKPKANTPIDENEIRITRSNEIVFKTMGRAINKTITIVELIKRRIIGLHQNTVIGSTYIIDIWEPLEEEMTRHVSMIVITLSKSDLNTLSPGYQPPLPADQVKASLEFDYDGGHGHGGRGRPRPREQAVLGREEALGNKMRHLLRGKGIRVLAGNMILWYSYAYYNTISNMILLCFREKLP